MARAKGHGCMVVVVDSSSFIVKRKLTAPEEPGLSHSMENKKGTPHNID